MNTSNKSMKLSALQSILMFFARRILQKYKPVIIGVTGNVGKTTTKDAIFMTLNDNGGNSGAASGSGITSGAVWASNKNYNNELGVPLSIIGAEAQGKSLSGWMSVFTKGFSLAFFHKEYPKTIILEMGIDKPGDMDLLLKLVHPHIMVIQQMGEIPVHLEFFKDRDELVAEKAKSVLGLGPEDVAVLNYDDRDVRAMAKKTKARVVTFGMEAGADVRATNLKRIADGSEHQHGLSCKIEYQGKSLPLLMPHIIASHQVYSVLAAIAVAINQQKNMVSVLETVKEFHPPKGRMNLLPGIKYTTLLDDTYNASPKATLEALDVLREIGAAQRKIAVLGDMLELGEKTEEAHREVGRKAASSADVLIAVGLRSKFTVDEALKQGMAKDRVFHFEESSKAGEFLDDFLEKEDVVLIKGSQGVRMEKITKEIMRDPLQAAELLVRQEENWQK